MKLISPWKRRKHLPVNRRYWIPSLTPAPNLNNLFGKILCITDDGEIPKDNPYYKANNKCNKKNTPANGGDKECPEIFSVGLHNPFNLAMDLNNESVRLYIGDVG
eukprot:scaffold108092_cov59-Attheya_sp.AAC.2